MTTQLSLFQGAGVNMEKPEPSTKVRLGNRIAMRNLGKRRKEALQKFCAFLDELEGKDIWISHCGGNRTHFWLNNLKLERLQVERASPGVVVLRGRREASVRVFTDRVVDLRRQEYLGCTKWLLDFWNGFGQYPIDPYRMPGYDALVITRFKD